MNLLTLSCAFFVTSLSLLALQPLAVRVGLIDNPGGRKTHEIPTPLIGGLGIYLGVIFITSFSLDLFTHYGALLLLSTIVLAVGILDDLRELSASFRLVTQAVAAILMCLVAGNELSSFGNVLGFGVVELGILTIPVTVFACTGVINAINMSDGLDGLSAGMVSIALGFLAFSAYSADNLTLLAFIGILLFSLLGFLTLNFRLPWKKPAMVYLGDAGSTFLGFILAWLMIESTQGAGAIIPPVLALWFLAVPLIDTVSLLIKRPLEGRSPFEPGRDHLHHKLIAAGFSIKATVITMYVISFCLGLVGLALHRLGADENLLFSLFLALFIAYFVLVLKSRSGSKQASMTEADTL